MYVFHRKLRLLKEKLKQWNGEVFGNIFHQQELLDAKMSSDLPRIQDEGLLELATQGSKILNKLKNGSWKKKFSKRKNSRLCGFKKGTRILNFSTIQKRNIKRILKLKKEDHNVVEKQEDITLLKSTYKTPHKSKLRKTWDNLFYHNP